MLGRQLGTALQTSAAAQLSRPVTTFFTTRLCVRVAPVAQLRLYATPGRPKKAVGEASKPIKRTVKKTTTTTATTAKKPVKKSAVVKKKAAKKVAKKPVRKVLTEQQKAKKQEKKVREHITSLKEAALKPPNNRKVPPYALFVKQQTGSVQLPSEISHQEAFVERAKVISQEFKALAPAQVEQLNHEVNTILQERQQAYESWVESHSTEQIEAANKARRALRRIENKTKKSGARTAWPEIEDTRVEKDAPTPYLQFIKGRWSSGDFANITAPDAAKLIAQEWQEAKKQTSDATSVQQQAAAGSA